MNKHLSSLVAAAVVAGGVGALGVAPAHAADHAADHRAVPAAVSLSGNNQIGLSTTEWKGIQRWLRANYSYTGPIDGLAGNNTWKAMQRYLKRFYGYTGAIDGITGTGTIKALQRCLSEGTYAGAIDGNVGPATIAAMKVFAAKFS